MFDALQSSFSQAPRTIALVARSSRAGTIALFALTTLASALPLGVAWAGKEIVDAVTRRDVIGALEWVGVELAVVAALAVLARGQALTRGLLGARLSLDVNVAILEKARALPLAQFEDPGFYDQLTRARREASSRPISVVTGLFGLGQGLLTLGGYVALLVSFSGWAVLGLVIAAIPATIAEVRYSSQAFRLRNFRAPETRRMAYFEYLVATDSHAKELKLFGLAELFIGRYRTIGEKLYGEDRRLALRRALVGGLLSLLATAAFYGCYGWLAWLAATEAISLGELTLYVVAFRQGQSAFQGALASVGGMYEDNLYMSNLFAFLDGTGRSAGVEGEGPAALPSATATATAAATAPASATAPAAATAPASARGAHLRFEGVSFRYPGSERWVLRHLDLDVPAGTRLALVGQNGCGKTTLIKLLTGLYTPTEGRILVDGRELREWDETALRARIGVVFQDFVRYQLPFRENVGVGSLPNLDDPARRARAVRRAGAEDVLAILPEGEESLLGKWFRLQGVELSGGQWQKVALARAFMREEADVLVLDEPTAALDAEAEHEVFQRFQELAEGRTTILISHRFPTVRTADRILVLEEGRISEDGTHAELLAAGGRYARMFRLQAEGYL